MSFGSIEFFPASGKLENEELIAAVEQAESEYGNITWLNKMPKTGGFGVVSFDLPGGGVANYGRFFQVIKAMHDQMSWTNKDIPGYSLDTKSGAKETAGMQPSDVLTHPNDNSPASVVKQIIHKFGKTHVLSKFAIAVLKGQSFPIRFPKSNDDLSFEGFRDYFCEMLHPISLMKGTASGNAHEAEAQFLPGSSFADCSISFSTSKTEGLSDSILVNPNGQNIKVSSKGKSGGAAASVKNLVEAIRELKNPKLIKKHKDLIELVDRMVAAGQKEAPSEIAMHYGIINQKEAGLITRLQEMVNTGTTHADILKGGYLTKRLQKIYNDRDVRDPNKVNPHAHMVAALAFLVGDYVNNKTEFSKSASVILNNAGLVTVDTKAKETAKEWEITSFESKFPGESITGVLLSAQKNYSSTSFRGNFTFKILKNNANPKAFADVKPDKAPGKQPKKKAPAKKLSAASGGAKTAKKGTTQRGKR
jgi:hypothetical protein